MVEAVTRVGDRIFMHIGNSDVPDEEYLFCVGLRGVNTYLKPKEHLEPVGNPRIVSDVSCALESAPARANAYTLSWPHSRTDLHGNVLYALQFYRIPREVVG